MSDDPDREFLLNGIEKGFDIIDPNCVPSPVEMKNHISASVKNPNFQKVHAQVLVEIENGNYQEVDTPPIIVSPLGAIPKPDGGVRLIHDCSRPTGQSVNSYVLEQEKFKFQSVDDAAKLVQPGSFMAKVDLKSAYRSVSISDHSKQVTGLKWVVNGHEKYFVDTKLPFGAKLAPGIFHKLSQAVCRFMANRGFPNVIAYLDDFFITDSTMDKCAHTLCCLIKLLRELGFSINWKKVVDPCKKLTFLGIEIDSVDMVLRLSEEKVRDINKELASFASRSRASKKQFQSLVGKLNWAAAVVRGGRVFLRRIIDKIVVLKHQHHKARLDSEMLADINWWRMFMLNFNGRSLILNDKHVVAVYTDACLEGGGGHWGDSWFYVNWNLDCNQYSESHINIKEVLAAVSAAQIWGPSWSNHKVILFSDNATTVAGINKGTSRNKSIMCLLRYLFWLSACHNFQIKACHIPGKNNISADVISRLHEKEAFSSIYNPLRFANPGNGIIQCMSRVTTLFLLCRHGWSAD